MYVHDVHTWTDIQRCMSKNIPSSLRVPYETVQIYGVPFMKGLVDKMHTNYGAEAPVLWIDCSVYPGLVMSAIRHGLTHLIFSGDRETYERLKKMIPRGELRYQPILSQEK